MLKDRVNFGVHRTASLDCRNRVSIEDGQVALPHNTAYAQCFSCQVGPSFIQLATLTWHELPLINGNNVMVPGSIINLFKPCDCV